MLYQDMETSGVTFLISTTTVRSGVWLEKAVVPYSGLYPEEDREPLTRTYTISSSTAMLTRLKGTMEFEIATFGTC